jgi:hypothetical protein
MAPGNLDEKFTKATLSAWREFGKKALSNALTPVPRRYEPRVERLTDSAI